MDENGNDGRRALEDDAIPNAPVNDNFGRRVRPGAELSAVRVRDPYQDEDQFEDFAPPASKIPFKSQFDDADEMADEFPPVVHRPPEPPPARPQAQPQQQLKAKRTGLDGGVPLPLFPKISAAEAAAKAMEFRRAMDKKREAMRSAMMAPAKAGGGASVPDKSPNHVPKMSRQQQPKAPPPPSPVAPHGAMKPAVQNRTVASSGPFIRNLTAHDVLCGPNVGEYPNAGNQFFRRLVRLRQENFRVAKKKPAIREAIVEFVFQVVQRLSPPGRFLGKDAAGSWKELGLAETRHFIAAALNEGVTGIVGWQRPVSAWETAGQEDDKEQPVIHRDYSKKRRYSQDAYETAERKRVREQDIIEIDSQSDEVEEVDPYMMSLALDRASARMRAFQQQQSNPYSASAVHMGALNIPTADGTMLQASEHAGLSSVGHGAHPALLAHHARIQAADRLAQAEHARLQAAGIHHSALLGGGLGTAGLGAAGLGADASSLAMSRLGRVPASIPTSLLLGTPPTEDQLHHATLPGGLVVMPAATAQQLQYSAMAGNSILAANRLGDARFMVPGSGVAGRSHLDGDYSQRSDFSGRSG